MLSSAIQSHSAYTARPQTASVVAAPAAPSSESGPNDRQNPDTTANRAPGANRTSTPVAGTTPTDTRAATQDESTSASTSPGGEELTESEQREVQELKARDREVRAHEQAHLAAAGPYARGGIQYTYERGPDRQQYAVGGQVSVDTSKVSGDPEATLRKAETLRRAALAPANPSSQDRSVAAEASRMAAEARAEIAEQRREEGMGGASATQRSETAPSDESATIESSADVASCPACGGRHSADAHDGMTAYAAQTAPPPSTSTPDLIASV